MANGRAGSKGRKRRTQAERSTLTRGRLLDATIESLIEVGYAHTTTIAVGERAGLSRGAQLHHFPSKSDLLIAAIEHLFEERAKELEAELTARLAEGGDTASVVVDILWSSFTGPLFWAALELMVAARTDRELREKLEPLERRLAGRVYRWFGKLLGPNEVDVGRGIEMTIYFLRGLAMERIFRRDDARYEAFVDRWKGFVRELLGPGASAAAAGGAGSG